MARLLRIQFAGAIYHVTNHLHLVLETPSGNLSRFMARLVTAYSVYYNQRHHRVGHLTQGRYKAQLVEGNQSLLKLSRYIHLNPVCGPCE